MLATEKAKFALIVCIGAIVGFGLVMLYSASSADTSILIKQSVYILAGISLAAVIRKIDYRRISYYAPFFLIFVALPLAYLVLSRLSASPLPLTRSIKGAFRWLVLGGFSLQPSEFAKVALIIFIASYYATYQKYVLTFRRGIVIPFCSAGVIIGLIFFGKNLSITIISLTLLMSMAFIAGVRIKYLILVVGMGLGAMAFDYYGLGGKYILPDYRLRRLASFQNPEADQLGDGYQLHRSQLALGAGGIDGRGFSNSILKHKYIPEKHTDFIASVIGEELGLIGICGIIIGFISFGYIGYSISANAVDYEGAYLAAGLTTSVLLHAFVNLSVVSGLGPTTGLTAPFISYGGSSILANFIGIGLLLSIARTSLKKQGDRLVYK